MIRYCETCKSEIPRGKMSTNNKKYIAKKYCCAKCHHESMKIEFEYNCAECNNTITRTKSNIKTNVFCNDVCKGRYIGKNFNNYTHRNPEHKISKLCLNCNKNYYIPNKRKNSKFCTQNCRAEYYAKDITKNQINRKKVDCDNCNNQFEKKVSDVRNLNFCKTDCMYEYYSKENLFTGSNSGTWNGGKQGYKGKNWLSQRRKIRKRDNYTCQECGITEDKYGQELSVHHIIPFIMFDDYKKANKDDNLICVCEPCHRKIHSGDNHPSKFKKTYGKSVDDIV